MDAIGDDVLIINLAMFGDIMRRIGTCVSGDFSMWVKTGFSWKFDAILLSAGGNDFIDAARDPGPGQGILKNLVGEPLTTQGRECLNRDALDALVTRYLNPNLTALYNQVQSSRHAGIPIFLNNYDTPTARNVPAFPGGRSWLFESFTKNSIPPGLWVDLTEGIFDEVQTTIAGWTVGRDHLISVPTQGTLVPAAADALGSSGDWLNEIHPNQAGWRKLAAVWRQAIKDSL